MKKKALALLLSLTLLASVFAGCGTTSTASTASTAAGSTASAKGDGKPTKLTMWTFVDQHKKYFDEMAAEWNKDNPDKPVQLEVTVIPYQDMHSQLLIALQSGNGAPDLADIEISKFPNFLKGDPQLVPLNDILDPLKDKIVQSRVEIYSKDGKDYGIDYHVGATVMYYNTELLQKAGIDYTKIVTWDDYAAAGKTLFEKTGKHMGFVETGAAWTFEALLAQQKSDVTKDDGSPNLNSKEAVKAAQLMQKMLKDGVTEVCPGGQPDVEEAKGYIDQGNIGSVLMPFWFMSRFVDEMKDLSGKIAIAPIPVMEKGMPRSLGLGGTGTTITKQCKSADFAKQFLAYAKLSEKATAKIWDLLGFDPINTSFWTNKDATHNKDNKFVKYFVNNPFDVINPLSKEIQKIKTVEATAPINDLLTTQTFNDLFVNNKDASTVLTDAQKNVENELKK